MSASVAQQRKIVAPSAAIDGNNLFMLIENYVGTESSNSLSHFPFENAATELRLQLSVDAEGGGL